MKKFLFSIGLILLFVAVGSCECGGMGIGGCLGISAVGFLLMLGGGIDVV